MDIFPRDISMTAPASNAIAVSHAPLAEAVSGQREHVHVIGSEYGYKSVEHA